MAYYLEAFDGATLCFQRPRREQYSRIQGKGKRTSTPAITLKTTRPAIKNWKQELTCTNPENSGAFAAVAPVEPGAVDGAARAKTAPHGSGQLASIRVGTGLCRHA